MRQKLKLPDAPNLDNYEELFRTITNHIKQKAKNQAKLNILEAGCGRRWALNLADIDYSLTGVDIDKDALDIRINKQKDMDIAVLADLKAAPLEDNSYDVIFNYNVLEHIDGAEKVLENFLRWLKPGGIMIIRFPNRDSVYGFLTRKTPFWFHIFFAKYIKGYKNAGKPGFDPYPTSFDKVVSRKGIFGFCKKHDLKLNAEYRVDLKRDPGKSRSIRFMIKILLWKIQIASFKKLTVHYYGLLYIIEKP